MRGRAKEGGKEGEREGVMGIGKRRERESGRIIERER